MSLDLTLSLDSRDVDFRNQGANEGVFDVEEVY